MNYQLCHRGCLLCLFSILSLIFLRFLHSVAHVSPQEAEMHCSFCFEVGYKLSLVVILTLLTFQYYFLSVSLAASVRCPCAAAEKCSKTEGKGQQLASILREDTSAFIKQFLFTIEKDQIRKKVLHCRQEE